MIRITLGPDDNGSYHEIRIKDGLYALPGPRRPEDDEDELYGLTEDLEDVLADAVSCFIDSAFDADSYEGEAPPELRGLRP